MRRMKWRRTPGITLKIAPGVIPGTDAQGPACFYMLLLADSPQEPEEAISLCDKRI